MITLAVIAVAVVSATALPRPEAAENAGPFYARDGTMDERNLDRLDKFQALYDESTESDLFLTLGTDAKQLTPSGYDQTITATEKDGVLQNKESTLDALGGGHLFRDVDRIKDNQGSIEEAKITSNVNSLMDKDSQSEISFERLVSRELAKLGNINLLRSVDPLGGGHLVRNLDSLDDGSQGDGSLVRSHSIGGGHLERNLDPLGGGHLIRSLDSLGGGHLIRSLDTLGGGHLLRSADPLGGGHLLRGLDSLGGGHLLRGLDSLGGGYLLRNFNSAEGGGIRSLDSLGGGHLIRSIDPLGGGNLIRGIKQFGRDLDQIGGGHLVRESDPLGGGHLLRDLGDRPSTREKTGESYSRALDMLGGGNLLRNLNSLERGQRIVKYTNLEGDSLDPLGGGNLLRSLDTLGGGHLIREVQDGVPKSKQSINAINTQIKYHSNVNSLSGNPNDLDKFYYFPTLVRDVGSRKWMPIIKGKSLGRGYLPGISQSFSRSHSLDSIGGGGNLLRDLESALRDNPVLYDRQSRNLDSLDGIAFGASKRFDSLSGQSFGNNKRNMDEIDRSGFDTFIKKNYDFGLRSRLAGKRDFDPSAYESYANFHNNRPIPHRNHF